MGLNAMNVKSDRDELAIGVVGAGSWGTALANLLAQKGYKIDHWVYEPEVERQMALERENKVFLPGDKAKYDVDYYLNSQVLPAVESIFDVFDVDVKAIVDGEKQKKLF